MCRTFCLHSSIRLCEAMFCLLLVKQMYVYLVVFANTFKYEPNIKYDYLDPTKSTIIYIKYNKLSKRAQTDVVNMSLGQSDDTCQQVTGVIVTSPPVVLTWTGGSVVFVSAACTWHRRSKTQWGQHQHRPDQRGHPAQCHVTTTASLAWSWWQWWV